MRNVKTCKWISSLTNQLYYRFGLFQNGTMNHSMISTLTNFTLDHHCAFEHQVSLDSTSPTHLGSSCPLHIHSTSTGLHYLQVLSSHFQCPSSGRGTLQNLRCRLLSQVSVVTIYFSLICRRSPPPCCCPLAASCFCSVPTPGCTDGG